MPYKEALKELLYRLASAGTIVLARQTYRVFRWAAKKIREMRRK
jgi:hypothetical protein